MEESKKVYKCNNFNCDCHQCNWLFRHCPICGQLYLWDMNNPEEPCADCEAELPAEPQKRNGVKGRSFNGRTSVSRTEDVGSNPTRPAN